MSYKRFHGAEDEPPVAEQRRRQQLVFFVSLHPRLGPWPVSVNEIYRRTRDGVFLTTQARAWKQAVRAAGDLAWAQAAPATKLAIKANEQLEVTYRYTLPNGTRLDADNLIKLAQDALAGALGCDDSRFRPVHSTIIEDSTLTPELRIIIDYERQSSISQADQPWPDEADAILRHLWPSAHRDVLIENLPGRTWHAIESRAKYLKLTGRKAPRRRDAAS